MLDQDSLERRVVELVLVSPSHRRPHTLVGPQAGEGVAEDRKQHLVFIEAPPARQDSMGVDLQEDGGERRAEEEERSVNLRGKHQERRYISSF